MPLRRRHSLARRLIASLAVSTLIGVPLVAATAGAVKVTREFYLVLGASESVGVQPTPKAPHGQPTPRGYANDLVALQAREGVSMNLVQMGCPGASTTTMLFGGDRCNPGTTQLARAINFLHAHARNQGVVTVDIGFNDLRSCFGAGGFDAACVDQQISVIQTQLPQIVDALKAAAGPRVTIVGLNHDNPFLASAVVGHATDRYVDHAATALDRMNATLDAVYASRNIAVANVAQAFAVDDTTPVTDPTMGVVPTNLARVCSLTWMCQPAPYGPNIHPNDAGYLAIAQAVDAILQ